MPVHIHRRYRQGNILCGETVHKGEIFLLRISPVSAPPVAEDETGKHGRKARQTVKVVKGGLIVVSVGENVEVLSFGGGRERSVGFQNKPFVFEKRRTVFAYHALRKFYFAYPHIEGAAGPFQIIAFFQRKRFAVG